MVSYILVDIDKSKGLSFVMRQAITRTHPDIVSVTL